MNWTEWIVMSAPMDLLCDVRVGLDAEGHWTLALVPDKGLPVILSGGCETSAPELLEQFISVIGQHAKAVSGE